MAGSGGEALETSPPPPPPPPPSPPPALYLLPPHLLEHILSHLPISTLLRLRSTSHHLLSLTNSPTFLSHYHPPHLSPDLHFLLFSNPTLIAAFHPTIHLWSLHPHPPSLHLPLLSSSPSLLLSQQTDSSIAAFNFFSSSSLHPIPPIPNRSYAIAAIGTPRSHKIVAVGSTTSVYDSQIGRWETKGPLPGRFAVIGPGVVDDGVLYCLANGPDRVLAFDLRSNEWRTVDSVVPAVACSHLVVRDGDLVLIGGLEREGAIVAVGVWAMDRTAEGGRWREMGFMPDDLFGVFGRQIGRFLAVDGGGFVCLYCTATEVVVLCDLRGMRWSLVPPCPLGGGKKWFGHAVEPDVELLQ